MAHLDPDYQFVAAVQHEPGRYRLVTEQLDAFFVPKRAVEVTPELLRAINRGIGYTRPAAAYVFQRR